MYRKIRIIKKHLPYVFLLLSAVPVFLTANDLSDAQNLENRGNTEEARSIYIRWLETGENRATPSFGRTLLHLLRMGGDRKELLELVDRHFPFVNNSEDRREILKYGAFLADLSGQFQRAGRYYSILENAGENQFDWVGDYYNISGNEVFDPADPLLFPASLETEEHAKNRAIVYLLSLSGNSSTNREFQDWLIRAEIKFPFLQNYPEWLYMVRLCCIDLNLPDKAETCEDRLLREYPDSPEAAVIRGEIHSLPAPLFFLTAEQPPAEEVILSTVQKDFIQAGAFSSRKNAESLDFSIREKTGLTPYVLQTGSVFKVLLESSFPERDLDLLKRNGFDGFRIPQPVQSR